MLTTTELLRRAAAALDDGNSPLDNWFLTENDVTIDQAYSLAGLLAAGARIMARGLDSPKSPLGVVVLLAMTAGKDKKEEGENPQCPES